VTDDSTLNEGFLVHKEDGTAQVFRPSKKGLFFSDVKDNSGHVIVNTVVKNNLNIPLRSILMLYVHVKEYSDAVHAHSLQDIIGRPTTADFIKYVENKMIPKCQITKGDILLAKDIFGMDIGSLLGKTTHRKTKQISTTIIDLPTSMLENHGKVTI